MKQTSCSQEPTFVMALQLTLFGESTVNTKSARRTYTRESKFSVVAVPRYQLFTQQLHRYSKLQRYNIGNLYDLTFSSCTHLPKRHRSFGGVVKFAFIIKRILGIKCIFPCSFGNKRMRLLTCVYSI